MFIIHDGSDPTGDYCSICGNDPPNPEDNIMKCQDCGKPFCADCLGDQDPRSCSKCG